MVDGMPRLSPAQNSFVQAVQHLPYRNFGGGTYSQMYFEKYLRKPHYDAYILESLVDKIVVDKKEIIIDFGGGVGMLSLMLHSKGFQKIVLVDHNKEACEFAKSMFKHLEIPIQVICGSQNDLPKLAGALVSRDVVEHIYDFPQFLVQQIETKKIKQFVFGTSANPHNLLRRRYFKKVHQKAEKEYFELRKRHFKKQGLTAQQSKEMAMKTKGAWLKEGDIEQKQKTQYSSNTCHPKTGNWAERLERISWYRDIVRDNKKWCFSVTFLRWNDWENHWWKKIIFACINKTNDLLNYKFLAPYLIYTYQNEQYN